MRVCHHLNKERPSEKVFRRPEVFVKPNICRTRAGGCAVQSSALFASHISQNNKFYSGMNEKLIQPIETAIKN
jgi:hypothetical protein